jgi:hypothetical protein
LSHGAIDFRVVGMKSVLLALTIAGTVATAPTAAVTPTSGLSSVRARWIPNVEAWPSGQNQRIATGDFNHDGADDLAIGMPWCDGESGAQSNEGMALVRFGVPGQGFVAASPVTLVQQGDSFPYAANNNLLGWAVAVGNFNGDAYDDLAVSAPGYSLDGLGNLSNGIVEIHFGRSWGIDPAAGQVLANVGSTHHDLFGQALAAGDFDGDGIDDLAIGSPEYHHFDGDSWISGGSVWVKHGTSSGLDEGFEIAQDDAQIPDELEAGDQFGYSLATGNFNGDWRLLNGVWRPVDDLAIGAPQEDSVGAVMILYGSEWSLLFGGADWWGEWHLRGTNEAGNRFAHAIAAGDFDGDGNDDLAIGAPWEDIGPGSSVVDGGAITLIYGTSSPNPYSFDLSRTEYFDQGSGTGIRTAGEQFGRALATGDFNGDGAAEVAIGRPQRDVIEQDRGSVSVIDLASPFGLGWAWSDLSPGLGGIPGAQAHANFGDALAAGDFDGDGRHDLAITAPDYYVTPGGYLGGQAVLYGALFADGFECHCLGYWVAAP